MANVDYRVSAPKEVLIETADWILRTHETGEFYVCPEALKVARILKSGCEASSGGDKNIGLTGPHMPKNVGEAEQYIVNAGRNPWLPLPGERCGAYEAFSCYLKSPSWTVRDVAEFLGRSYPATKALSQRWSWNERRRAFQEHLVLIFQRELEERTLTTAWLGEEL